jgi:thymidylate synthase
MKMNKLDKQYTDLLQDILDNGTRKMDRTGTGTISVFGRQIRHKMSDGFPLLTTKKMAWKTMVTELLWFLRGDTNIKFLVDNNCHIWDGDAYKNYERRWETEGKFLSPPVNKFTKEELINEIKTNPMVAKELGDLGPVYGAQWRNWGEWSTLEEPKKVLKPGIDQIANLIRDLKTNPDSRRLMVNAWNVGELDQMTLPPCHYGFQVYTRELSLEEKEWQLEKTNCINDIETDRIIYGQEWEKYIEEQYEGIESTQGIKIPTRAISLMWNQRSVDTPLGLPFNIASYGLLLEIIAKTVNMVPDELIGNLGDCHIYLNQVDGVKEQIGRELTHRERIEKLLETNKDAKSLLSQEEPEVISSLLLDELKVPRRTREPYPLPTLKHMKTDEFYKSLSEDLSLLTHLDNTDFVVENYQSHPTIKIPLSN